MGTHKYKIKDSKKYLRKSCQLVFDYVKKKSKNNEISVTTEMKNKICKLYEYEFATINNSFTILKNEGYLELVSKKSKLYKRKFHLEYKPGSPEYRKSAYLKNQYSITIDEYKKLQIDQDNKCAICKRGEDEITLVIDHCHTTGKVRGLLCFACNNGIGAFRDNTIDLMSAIEYLNKNLENLIE